MITEEEIGLLIRKLRNKKGLAQDELAYKASITRSYMGEIERAEKKVSLEYIQKITIALDISLSDFFKILEKNK